MELKNASVGGDSPIVFNSPVVGVPTKSYSAFPAEYHFDVWALFSASTISGLNSTSSLYLNGLEFAKVDNSWTNAGAFWPKQNGYLTFHAFYPHGVATHSFTDDNTGFRVASFDASVATPADLIYSDYAANKQKTNEDTGHSNPSVATGYTGIDILFHHALAKVKFQVKLNEVVAGTTYAVTKVEIKNQYKVGSFQAYTTYATDSFGTASPSWSVSVNTASNEMASYVQVSEALSPIPSDTDAHALTGELFVLPQYLDHSETHFGSGASTNKVTAKITFTEKIGLLDAQTITAEFALNGLTEQWSPGKIYTYTILIKHDPILLDPGVEDWDSLAAVDYDHA